jgi:hypothetical protein
LHAFQKGIIADTIKGFEARAKYDETFKNKVAIELTVGFLTQSLAEFSERGTHSFEQIDYIIADLIQGICASFFAVYLSAPVDKVNNIVDDDDEVQLSNSFERVFADCPENAFQKETPGGPRFSSSQRVLSIIKASPQLFATGFIGMSLGSLCTSLLSSIRVLFSDGVDLHTLLSIENYDTTIETVSHQCIQAVAVGFYLALSTNIRYQFVAGVLESRIIDPLLLNDKYSNKFLHGGTSFLVRTANTYFGSYMMVEYLQLLGLQR